jgi:co-chaperonin GroES (HSP10)
MLCITMNKEFAKEIHHRALKKFQRRKVSVMRKDEIWGLDLAFMDSWAEYNDGYKFILCIIDVFSKFAWCVPLKNKTAKSTLDAVIDVVLKSERLPEKIWVDKGSEFYNKDFKNWAKQNGIVMYSTYGESKSVVVERFLQTLKNMLTKYFSATNTRNWVKILPKIMKKYNNRIHKTIGMTPTEASADTNEGKVFTALNNTYHENVKKGTQKFKVGDYVRISRMKGTFEKGYQPNFSHEVFQISKVLNTNPITYKLTDYHGDEIEGSFYQNELLKTNTKDYYEVEKILDERKVGNKKEYLVKFHGWDKKFNEWLSEEQIHEIQKDKTKKEIKTDFIENRTKNTSKFWKDMIEKLQK